MIKWHIFLSTLSLIVMIIAGIEATLLIIQDYLLRHIQTNILRFLPSMEKLERYLFRTIILGFILLVGVFISSILFFGNVFGHPLREKSFLTITAIFIFAILLWGRYQKNWRGRTAIRWTFLGVILLLIIYCGTGLLLHVTY
jgi:ABC-type uncharacterized transport system permease subunit